jgi:uncharacterized protein
MTRRIGLLVSVLGVLILFETASAQTIGIMTTPPGSFVHSAGAAIAKVIVEKVGLKATVQPTATRPFGAVDGGLADFSISNAFDLTVATLGADEYKEQGPKPNLRLAATLMPMASALYVRKDSSIRSIKDLKGKRIASGFHAQKALVRAIQSQLANAGLTYEDVIQVPAANISRASEDFSNGKTDVMFFAFGTAGVMEISTKVGGLRALPIDDSSEAMERMNKVNPSEYAMEVRPGPNMEGITEPIKVIALDNVLFTHAKVRDDVIYKVVKALYENKPDLVASFPPFRGFAEKRIATPVPNVEFHPGAAKFYKEVDLWPPKR